MRRLEDLRNVFARNPEQARSVMERLLEGKLTFTPIQTDDGKRYRIEGRVSLGEALQIPADPSAPYSRCPQGDTHVTDGLRLLSFPQADAVPVLKMAYVA